MQRQFWLSAAIVVLLAPVVATAQQERMARPEPVRPGNGGPQIQPPRPGNGGPQIQPPRPGNGGPQIQPPRPGRPEPVRPDRPRPPRPPQYGGGFHRPPNYRPPVYRYPRGYAYRRWQVGAVLPALLFGSGYYFNDYLRFGIGAPPRNYRWVRYGPDLVLVNIRTGRIRDIRYGVFR